MKTKPMEIVFVVCLVLIAPCLAVHIAFNKPGYQIGVYKNATADKAVDGRHDVDTGDDYYLSVCAHPNTTFRGNGPATWWVDLEDIYRISNVTVWNTYNRGGYWRMNNFTVELVTQDNTTKQNCGDYTKPEPVSRGDKYTFNCNNKQGRYVYVRRLRSYKEQQYLILCEVEVEGSLVSTISKTTPTTTETVPVTISTTTLTLLSSSEQNTQTSVDTAKPCTCSTTLSWVLFGVACLDNIIFATLYFLARKQQNHANDTTSQPHNSTLEQNVTSYPGNSIRHQDVITSDQQSIHASNIDNAAYEDVHVNNIRLTNGEREKLEINQQYQSLHGQVADYDTNYERIQAS